MTLHRTIRSVVNACILAVAVSFGQQASSKTTDYSDVWASAAEDGWSVLFVQQDLTIFAAMYVYGPDGKATWYAAALAYQGGNTFVWSGELFTATGPWFANVPFASTAVTVTVVGTMTFSGALTDLRKGTLTYTVNGMQVEKQIQRYTFASEYFGGTYSGVMRQHGTGATCDSAGNSNALPVSVQIKHNSTAMAIVTRSNTNTCTFPGTYSQAGHFGLLLGSYVCTSGDHGNFLFLEMAASYYDFRSRIRFTDQTGCVWDGYINGIKLPQ